MPMTESLTSPASMNVQAREAHITRTQDRITYWRGRVETAATDNERSLILGELQELETQLHQALHPEDGQAVASPAASIVQTLKDEIAELKGLVTKLLGRHEPAVPQPGSAPDA